MKSANSALLSVGSLVCGTEQKISTTSVLNISIYVYL